VNRNGWDSIRRESDLDHLNKRKSERNMVSEGELLWGVSPDGVLSWLVSSLADRD
jgi:hypothetical protein